MVDPVFKNSLVVVVDTSPPKWTPHKHKPNPGFKANDGSAAVTEVTGTAVPWFYGIQRIYFGMGMEFNHQAIEIVEQCWWMLANYFEI